MSSDGEAAHKRTPLLRIRPPESRQGVIARSPDIKPPPVPQAERTSTYTTSAAPSAGQAAVLLRQTLSSISPEPTKLHVSDITDWFIPEGDESSTRVYPGARQVSGDLLAHAARISDLIRKRKEAGKLTRDYRIEYEGQIMRGHMQETVEGVMHILRRMSRELPSVHVLGLPPEVKRALTDKHFGEHGGLILFTGGAGAGKSTTASAVVTERVINHGAFCLCVEDPPEFMLHGDHQANAGKVGKIIQVPAQSSSFSECLRDALRCYPSNTKGSMLLIGEIRDSHTAEQALKAAVNGQLVIATFHASDPIAALDRILSMGREHLGSDVAKSLLAHSIRAVIHQSLANGSLSSTCLFSMNAQTAVAASISSGQIRLLTTELEQQKVFIDKGLLLNRLGLSTSFPTPASPSPSFSAT